MTGLGAVVALCVAGLIAWRWWLSDKAAARGEKLVVDQKALDALPGRMAALESVVKELEWKVGKK